jgi:patatin-like phospholipase/acyl hydrolase
VNVLAIAGGGIRGLIPALVLAEIERRTGRRTRDLVDLVAGTSTGAILPCALTHLDPLPAERIADLYVEEGPRIFDRSLVKVVTSAGGYLDERYEADGLVAALERWLGCERLTAARL